MARSLNGNRGRSWRFSPLQKKAPVIHINQEVLHDNLSGYVRKNLESVLNELLDAEADRLCHAKRYERNAERASTRALQEKF